MADVYRGDDVEIVDTVKDENGVLIAVNSLATITVEVCHHQSGDSLKSGTKAAGIVKIVDADAGQIGFYIDDELTASATLGSYDYILSVEEADSNFADAKKTTTYVIENVFYLKRKKKS